MEKSLLIQIKKLKIITKLVAKINKIETICLYKLNRKQKKLKYKMWLKIIKVQTK